MTTTLNQLELCMETQKPYLINDLSLNTLADVMDINPRSLSRLINEKAGTNFYDYINTYRLNEFKKGLKRTTNQPF